ncbi:MAG TPA: bifunctional alpha/beta hydrolase/class I SAM-dependent methyltransferase [Thermoanaerobaculia bacterium]|nr:bifunctional alpha/beta hydrolase/class I SAM-dependent methyltransferase [Thermoanaerobaculia bacterium]
MRECHENQFRTFDGLDLFYRYWPATSGRCAGAIVLFHRGHEHSGRMAHLADELGLDDFAFYAWDARGHGRSPGPRGYSPSIGTSVRDVNDFVGHVAQHSGQPIENIAVIAQSVGAVTVATWLHDYAPRIRCAVLASPAFKVKLYVPFARSGLSLMSRIRGNFYVKSYVKAKFLTHDPERIESFKNDPLISRAISSNILLELYTTADRIVADAQAITVPLQLLISGADWVVHHKPQHDFFDRLGSLVKERHVLPGFYHDTLGELNREQALVNVREFIRSRFAEPRKFVDLTSADKAGPTREEADRLAAPLPALSPRGLYWSLTRLSMRIGGALSDGIKLGHETGFDSGSTLDYVYRNTPSGRLMVGGLIDRNYLNSIGWRGIRERKRNLESLIRDAMDRLRKAGAPVHVLDIAAGHGRYVLEALESGDLRPDSILLRDYSELNVRQGSALIEAKGLQSIARFVAGDAFDRASLASVTPRPTLAIVSGLYELFADNDLVGRSLAGVADAVAAGGYLIYTCQPWHPQLELIARALTSHRGGKAWVMRRRTQGEMDQLVERAGFTKLAQRIDDWGIFTVSLAVRNGGAPAR